MENTDDASVAEQYRHDGYRVAAPPTADDLPDFLSGFVPSLLAQKNGENVVIAVVDKARLNEEKHFFGYWLAKVNAQPGWRFDLVITDSSPWTEKLVGDAREWEVGEIRQRNQELRKSLEHGLLEPICLFAWALLEAALRVLAKGSLTPLKSKMPNYVINQLYTEGAISNGELDKLQRLMAIRNSVAHGLKTAKLDEGVIGEMTDMTDHLLSLAAPAVRPHEHSSI